MRLSKMHIKTLREVPNEAEIPSHILLLRGGMIRKLVSGVYGFMPLGWRSVRKIEEIIRQEGFSNIMALISVENEASIRLFEKCGFECCANIRQVAEKFGKKLDLKMYQKIISDNSHLTP